MSKSRLERVGNVHLLTLADDAKRNAIGYELASELVSHADVLTNDPDARALVVTGEGRAFCAGADLPQVFGPERSTAETRASLRSFYECFLAIRALPFPTFAAVNGPAVGAGLNLALSCDIRLAGPAATFGATFTKIGLHPGGGCTAFLVAAVGRERALALLLEGTTLDARQACDIGLVAAVDDDPLSAALARAETVATLEPWLARSVKRATDLVDFEAVLEFETWAQAESTHNERFRDWVERFA